MNIGVWNCFNYTRTRQLKHARDLLSSLISSFGPSRRQSSAGFTEQETRYTTVAAAVNSPDLNRSLLDELDDNDGDERLSRCDELQLVSFGLLLQRRRLLGISA